jgi:hypothetical protein
MTQGLVDLQAIKLMRELLLNLATILQKKIFLLLVEFRVASRILTIQIRNSLEQISLVVMLLPLTLLKQNVS